jgi:four helix bundle protein
MSYQDLEIWRLADEVVVEIHKMTLRLPKFETYETGAQIRRSSKSTKACIAEGYGRRQYKAEYIKFLIYSRASNDETIDHLTTLCKTGSLQSESDYILIHDKLVLLGKTLTRFIQGVKKTTWNKKL